MRARDYCAYTSIRDHWALRCMSRCPDQVVSLNAMPKLWRWVVSPSIVSSGNFAELNRVVTYLYGAQDQRQAYF
ncbi:hypothetical protein TNCV_3644611 [Trichonephila clavipes]|nr:hypothetical protein TNCV_3644611 [Trichonephila clavipes]